MESSTRLIAFGCLFLIIAGWEALAPRRQLRLSRWQRWPANLALSVVNILGIRLLLASAAVGAALWAEQANIGLFHMLNWPLWLEYVLCFALLDLSIYWQHRLFHVIPLLWRMHRVHHADLDLDVSSGVRFHPLEGLLSMLGKMAVIVALGIAPSLVLIFELVLNLCATFNHGNIYISPRVDRYLRYILVTPDFHRIHHSTELTESQKNYGFSVPWWDYLFGSYLPEAQRNQTDMELGLAETQTPAAAQSFSAAFVKLVLR